MRLVIIEGIDNAGKDTLINRLKTDYQCSYEYHCKQPETNDLSEPEKEYASLVGISSDEYINNVFDLFILNRCWYSEFVYGTIYRNQNELESAKMVCRLETVLNRVFDPDDICYITLLADADFIVKNDDGLSLSKNKKDIIQQEIELFTNIYDYSNIKNKHIIKVNNGDKFRDKDDIYNELLSYLKL